MIITKTALTIQDNNRWLLAFRLAWQVYLPIRITLLVVGIVIGILGWSGPSSAVGPSWFEQTILSPWDQMDVDWYLRIARDGYGISDGRAAFHPLFPLLVGIIGRIIGGHYLLASFIVNDLACLGALMILYRLIKLDHRPSVAYATIQWLLLIPMGFVLMIPYTEALTLCLLGFTFWFWRHERWLAAGLGGCFATLTKQPAIALLPALTLDYLYHHRRTIWRWETAKVMLSVSLIPFGYGLFSIYRVLIADTLGANSGIGSIIVSSDLNKVWGSRFGWPWESISRIIKYSFGPTDWVFWIEIGLSVAAIAIFLCTLRYYRNAIAIFGIVQIMLISTIILTNDPMMSYPRRFLLVMPIFLQLALWSTATGSRSKYWRIASLTLMLILSAAYTTNQFTP